jgi:hypothetical protein
MQFVRIGLPLVSFVVIGAYGLSKLNQGRFDDKERKKRDFEVHHRPAFNNNRSSLLCAEAEQGLGREEEGSSTEAEVRSW